MAMLSPGVYVAEVDASAIVPTVSNNVAFLAGNFNTGPIDLPFVVTTKKEYEEKFGTPSDRNYNEWYQGFKFFDYANQLIITRGYERAPSEIGKISDDKITFFNIHGEVDVKDVPGAPGDTIGKWTTVLVKKNMLGSRKLENLIHVGDFISFGDMFKSSGSNPGSGAGTVTKIDEIELEKVAFFKITSFMVDVEPGGANCIYDNVANGPMYIHSYSHQNGGTQAFIDDGQNTATDDKNIFNATRYSYKYELIKNEVEFDYLYENKELHSFNDGAIFKFYSRYADESKIEIAIANHTNFKPDSNNRRKAIAFSSPVSISGEQRMEDVYLDTLFEYNPQVGQIGIAIRKGSEIESFVVELDRDAIDGNHRSTYIENVINENSKLVYVVYNDALGGNVKPLSYLVCDELGWQVNAGGNGLTNWGVPAGEPTQPLVCIGGRNPKISKGQLQEAYESVLDHEKYEIDVVIGNEDHVNEAIDLAEKRKDCIAYVGTRYQECVGKKANDAVNANISYLLTGNGSEKPKRTMFAAMFANYFRIYDKFNKRYRWINVAGDMAGLRCQVSGNQDAWWVSAGMTRGNIRNISKLAFTPSQPQRDTLYKEGLNPIVSFPGTGNLVWGNKTLHPIASSFDRINVRTLFNTLERSMAKAARSQVFEFNDPYTRNAIVSMFNPFLATIKSGRGITDYLVVCDTTNNTPDVISRNELRCDIYVRPNYAAEMILLTFTNVGTRSFSDVVGV